MSYQLFKNIYKCTYQGKIPCSLFNVALVVPH